IRDGRRRPDRRAPDRAAPIGCRARPPREARHPAQRLPGRLPDQEEPRTTSMKTARNPLKNREARRAQLNSRIGWTEIRCSRSAQRTKGLNAESRNVVSVKGGPTCDVSKMTAGELP